MGGGGGEDRKARYGDSVYIRGDSSVDGAASRKAETQDRIPFGLERKSSLPYSADSIIILCEGVFS